MKDRRVELSKEVDRMLDCVPAHLAGARKESILLGYYTQVLVDFFEDTPDVSRMIYDVFGPKLKLKEAERLVKDVGSILNTLDKIKKARQR